MGDLLNRFQSISGYFLQSPLYYRYDHLKLITIYYYYEKNNNGD